MNGHLFLFRVILASIVGHILDEQREQTIPRPPDRDFQNFGYFKFGKHKGWGEILLTRIIFASASPSLDA